TVRVSFDERSNKVLVSGPPDKIDQARKIMQQIDVPQKGQQPLLVGPPTLKVYPAPGGNADQLVKALQAIYKASDSLRISAVNNSPIMVWAGPDDQVEIAKHIYGSAEQNSNAELITLTALEANKVIETLKGMFGDVKTGAPYLDADMTRNAIIVKGTAEQLGAVKAAL